MTRRDYEVFRDEVLRERFFWTKNTALRRYLMEKGYRYLFRCTHFKTNRYFWVFDKSDDLLKDVADWHTSNSKQKGVSDNTPVV